MFDNLLISLLIIPIILIFFIVSYQLRQGKWLMLIAGYNMITSEERAKLDSQKIAKESSTMMFWAAIYCVFIYLFMLFPIKFLVNYQWLLFTIFIVPTAILIYYTVQHVKKTNRYFNEKLKK
ncbi:DUF3784 domain-containing protein [Vagococcus silagei]|uniref:DUF3784 domain-containing protein n=1 Tax=Vagococcus silagei TaxID=2508885 RepID=A0A4S3B9N7_9ENTE|nr:DUF3784 domain-containing protein [Vagococcus silagei]THB61835.1 DUF3784 domain-containing protein [Vagococcus silagei]